MKKNKNHIASTTILAKPKLEIDLVTLLVRTPHLIIFYTWHLKSQAQVPTWNFTVPSGIALLRSSEATVIAAPLRLHEPARFSSGVIWDQVARTWNRLCCPSPILLVYVHVSAQGSSVCEPSLAEYAFIRSSWCSWSWSISRLAVRIIFLTQSIQKILSAVFHPGISVLLAVL